MGSHCGGQDHWVQPVNRGRKKGAPLENLSSVSAAIFVNWTKIYKLPDCSNDCDRNVYVVYNIFQRQSYQQRAKDFIDYRGACNVFCNFDGRGREFRGQLIFKKAKVYAWQ